MRAHCNHLTIASHSRRSSAAAGRPAPLAESSSLFPTASPSHPSFDVPRVELRRSRSTLHHCRVAPSPAYAFATLLPPQARALARCQPAAPTPPRPHFDLLTDLLAAVVAAAGQHNSSCLARKLGHVSSRVHLRTATARCARRLHNHLEHLAQHVAHDGHHEAVAERRHHLLRARGACKPPTTTRRTQTKISDYRIRTYACKHIRYQDCGAKTPRLRGGVTVSDLSPPQPADSSRTP